jgi:hypothetical protein
MNRGEGKPERTLKKKDLVLATMNARLPRNPKQNGRTGEFAG